MSISIALALAAAAPVAPPPPMAVVSTYTNEEEVYFDKEAGRAPAPWIGVTIDTKGTSHWIDVYGKPAQAPAGKILRVFPATIMVELAGGRRTTLLKARGATCWVAIRKDKPKPDGKEDWYFTRDVKLHDQGGRAIAGGGDTGAQQVIVRMRNVIWPPPTSNKPSLVMYIHKPETPDRAESYSWADEDAVRVGINLRWMQSSCAIDRIGQASEVTSKSVKG